VNERELKEKFNEIVGASEIKWKVFLLFKRHASLNYKIVATCLNIQRKYASACLADLEACGILISEKYGKYILNGKNLEDALANALALKASRLNMEVINLKIAAEGVS